MSDRRNQERRVAALLLKLCAACDELEHETDVLFNSINLKLFASRTRARAALALRELGTSVAKDIDLAENPEMIVHEVGRHEIRLG